MAAINTARLMSCELLFQKVTIHQNADNPAILTEHFIELAECMESYFRLSVKEMQSAEVKESRSRFCWAWLELPQFPMRELLPAAAKALQRFPTHRGLVLAIADWCIDVCKSNVLAKMEAMRCGMLQGLCLAAGHLALCEKFGVDECLLAGCIFEALRKAAETPSINFYSLPFKMKDEFYAVAREAWLGVKIDTVLEALEKRGTLAKFKGPQPPNPALLLTALFLRRASDVVTMQHYLHVVTSLGEAFSNTFPTMEGNLAFQKFLRDTFEGFQGKVLPEPPSGNCGDLLDEALLIHIRTLNIADVPWNHRNSCLNPALNELYRDIGTVSEAQISQQVVAYDKMRKPARREHLKFARRFAAADAAGCPSNRSAGIPANGGTVENNDKTDPSCTSDTRASPETGGASSPQPGGRKAKTRACANCSRDQKGRAPGEPAFKKCSWCMAAYYCGPQCQKVHWKEHKLVCART